jgi:hypothetical protein
MSLPCALKTPNAKSRLPEQSHGKPGGNVIIISLSAFLQAENRRLQNMVAELKQDILALQQASQNN